MPPSEQCWPFSSHDKPYQISSTCVCNRTIRVALWPDFEPLWFAFYVILAYILAARHPAVALILGSYLYVLKLTAVLSKFGTDKGVLKVLSYRKHQVGLFDVV